MNTACSHAQRVVIGHCLGYAEIMLPHAAVLSKGIWANRPMKRRLWGAQASPPGGRVWACPGCKDVTTEGISGFGFNAMSIGHTFWRFHGLPPLAEVRPCGHGKARLAANVGFSDSHYEDDYRCDTETHAWLMYRCPACDTLICVFLTGTQRYGEKRTKWNTSWFRFGGGALPAMLDALGVPAEERGKNVVAYYTNSWSMARE